jgi:hypothetical protein
MYFLKIIALIETPGLRKNQALVFLPPATELFRRLTHELSLDSVRAWRYQNLLITKNREKQE